MILKALDARGPLHGFGIARRLEQVSGPGSTPVASEVIGVVDDVRELGPVRPPRRMVFIPQFTTSAMPMFLIRARHAARSRRRARPRK